MKILVTGGAGFIGSNFIRLYQSRYPNVTVLNLDKLTYAGNLENLKDLASPEKHIFINGDINDRALVSGLLSDYEPSAIINFAAETHVDRSIENPAAFIETNINGTFNLLECAKDFYNKSGAEKNNFRFIQISTDEVFGSLEAQDAAFTESHPVKPNSPYSASKAAADHLVRSYFHTYNLPVIITHCSNNYGPKQSTDKLIPVIIRNALAGMTIPIYGDGKNIRDWLYVEDHCEAIIKILEYGRIGESYNIGGDTEKTNLEIAAAICEQLDIIKPLSHQKSYKNLITFVKDRPGHDRRYAVNSSKIKKELGFKAEMDFERGILKTINFYLSEKH